MVKFGCIKCETCGQQVNKKRIKQHKCNKLDPTRKEKCVCCGKEMSMTNMAAHYRRCRVKCFWKEFRLFFLFLLKLIRAYNKELHRQNLIGGKKSKFKIIEEYQEKEGVIKDDRINLYKHQQLLIETAEKREQMQLAKAKETAEEEGLDFDKLVNVAAIKESIINGAPGISCRQVICDYLRAVGMTDENVFQTIDKKLKNKDYSTDAELERNPFLFRKIKKLREMSNYRDTYDKFYYFFGQYYEDRSFHKCKFCQRFFVNVKNHLKLCPKIEAAFNANKEAIIEEYLRKYYKAGLWMNDKLYYFIDYYKTYSVKYFLETIDRHIKDRFKFREKIEAGHRTFCKMHAPKWNVKDFVQEVKDWVDMPEKILPPDDNEEPESIAPVEESFSEEFKDLVEEVDGAIEEDEEEESKEIDDELVDAPDEIKEEASEVLEEYSQEEPKPDPEPKHEQLVATMAKLFKRKEPVKMQEQESKSEIDGDDFEALWAKLVPKY